MSEPRTEAGRNMLMWLDSLQRPGTYPIADAILAIEREAAAPQPLDVERLGLSHEQTSNLRQHLLARQQTLGEWISDVLFDMRMGRADGIDYPPPARLSEEPSE